MFVAGYHIVSYSLPFSCGESEKPATIRNVRNVGYNANNQIVRTGFAYDENSNPTLFDGVNYDYESRVVQVGTMLIAYHPDGKRTWKQPVGVSARTYYPMMGRQVILEFNPADGFCQAHAYGANGLACSERLRTYRILCL